MSWPVCCRILGAYYANPKKDTSFYTEPVMCANMIHMVLYMMSYRSKAIAEQREAGVLLGIGTGCSKDKAGVLEQDNASSRLSIEKCPWHVMYDD